MEDARAMTDAGTTAQQRVIVALDGSPAALAALPFAGQMARQMNASLEALYVGAERPPEDRLRTILSLDTPDLPDIPIRFRAGEPFEQVRLESEEDHESLMVLTTHDGATKERHRLGRVVEAVMTGSGGPVMLVRPEATGEAGRAAGSIQRVLAPLDGKRATADALAPAGALVTRLGAAMDVLYVVHAQHAAPEERGGMSAPRYVDQPHHEWPQWAAEVRERFCVHCAGLPADAHVNVYIRQGDPAREITEFARERDYDAIVLIRSSRLQRGRARTLRAVLENTTVPVFLVRG